MSLVTTQPITINDNQGTPVLHTFTYHYQDVTQPLGSVYTSDQADTDNMESFRVSYSTTRQGRNRGLAQISFNRNMGTVEVPSWEPHVFNITYSVPKGAENDDVECGLTLLANLLAEAGFIAGFRGRYLE